MQAENDLQRNHDHVYFTALIQIVTSHAIAANQFRVPHIALTIESLH